MGSLQRIWSFQNSRNSRTFMVIPRKFRGISDIPSPKSEYFNSSSYFCYWCCGYYYCCCYCFCCWWCWFLIHYRSRPLRSSWRKCSKSVLALSASQSHQQQKPAPASVAHHYHYFLILLATYHPAERLAETGLLCWYAQAKCCASVGCARLELALFLLIYHSALVILLSRWTLGRDCVNSCIAVLRRGSFVADVSFSKPTVAAAKVIGMDA